MNVNVHNSGAKHVLQLTGSHMDINDFNRYYDIVLCVICSLSYII